MNNQIPKLDIRKIKRISQSLKPEEMGLLKMIAGKCLYARDIDDISEDDCYVLVNFLSNKDKSYIMAARKLDALNLISLSENTITINLFLLYIAGYNGIDSDDLKKPKNIHMLGNNDLLAWSDFLKID